MKKLFDSFKSLGNKFLDACKNNKELPSIPDGFTIDVNTLHTKSGYFCLHEAARFGNKKNIKELFKLGAAVNLRTENGEKKLALQVAIENKRQSAAILLLEHPAFIADRNLMQEILYLSIKFDLPSLFSRAIIYMKKNKIKIVKSYFVDKEIEWYEKLMSQLVNAIGKGNKEFTDNVLFFLTESASQKIIDNINKEFGDKLYTSICAAIENKNSEAAYKILKDIYKFTIEKLYKFIYLFSENKNYTIIVKILSDKKILDDAVVFVKLMKRIFSDPNFKVENIINAACLQDNKKLLKKILEIAGAPPYEYEYLDVNVIKRAIKYNDIDLIEDLKLIHLVNPFAMYLNLKNPAVIKECVLEYAFKEKNMEIINKMITSQVFLSLYQREKEIISQIVFNFYRKEGSIAFIENFSKLDEVFYQFGLHDLQDVETGLTLLQLAIVEKNYQLVNFLTGVSYCNYSFPDLNENQVQNIIKLNHPNINIDEDKNVLIECPIAIYLTLARNGALISYYQNIHTIFAELSNVAVDNDFLEKIRYEAFILMVAYGFLDYAYYLPYLQHVLLKKIDIQYADADKMLESLLIYLSEKNDIIKFQEIKKILDDVLEVLYAINKKCPETIIDPFAWDKIFFVATRPFKKSIGILQQFNLEGGEENLFYAYQSLRIKDFDETYAYLEKNDFILNKFLIDFLSSPEYCELREVKFFLAIHEKKIKLRATKKPHAITYIESEEIKYKDKYDLKNLDEVVIVTEYSPDLSKEELYDVNDEKKQIILVKKYLQENKMEYAAILLNLLIKKNNAEAMEMLLAEIKRNIDLNSLEGNFNILHLLHALIVNTEKLFPTSFHLSLKNSEIECYLSAFPKELLQKINPLHMRETKTAIQTAHFKMMLYYEVILYYLFEAAKLSSPLQDEDYRFCLETFAFYSKISTSKIEAHLKRVLLFSYQKCYKVAAAVLNQMYAEKIMSYDVFRYPDLLTIFLDENILKELKVDVKDSFIVANFDYLIKTKHLCKMIAFEIENGDLNFGAKLIFMQYENDNFCYAEEELWRLVDEYKLYFLMPKEILLKFMLKNISHNELGTLLNINFNFVKACLSEESHGYYLEKAAENKHALSLGIIELQKNPFILFQHQAMWNKTAEGGFLTQAHNYINHCKNYNPNFFIFPKTNKELVNLAKYFSEHTSLTDDDVLFIINNFASLKKRHPATISVLSFIIMMKYQQLLPDMNECLNNSRLSLGDV